jgi:hypothetical protein
MRVVLLSIPGLREQDLEHLPQLRNLTAAGESRPLSASFPAVTWPVQANMLTGRLPDEHGVVANGFYWRDRGEVEMWTAWNEVIQRPQVWDRLRERGATSAVWFPMLSKGCSADFVCMPAPIHNPDGSESLWCYTKPREYYGELRDALGHFPLQHFWGPLANIKSTAWIADSSVLAAARFQPDFFFIYLPHLDYAAQKSGPDSPAARAALGELDSVLEKLIPGLTEAGEEPPAWLAASEYVITAVNHVTYPNRVLRDAGLLQVRTVDDREHLDLTGSQAWALVDHQFSHVFVRDRDPRVIRRVAEIFSGQDGVAEVLSGNQRDKYSLSHERSGDVILISTANSWQAYYWWHEDGLAPAYARTVDIHAKPGYDPVELHFDPATRGIPLDATRIGGSHGAPVTSAAQRGLLLCSRSGGLPAGALRDVQVAELILRLQQGS